MSKLNRRPFSDFPHVVMAGDGNEDEGVGAYFEQLITEMVGNYSETYFACSCQDNDVMTSIS